MNPLNTGETDMATTKQTYRNHAFVVDAKPHGSTWQGFFHLLDLTNETPLDASHKWVPTTSHWLTRREAETNASEAAHAAIDALVDGC